MASRTGRLRLAPDDHSGTRRTQTTERPRSPRLVTEDRCGAGAGNVPPRTLRRGRQPSRQRRRHGEAYPPTRAVRQWDPRLRREHHTAAVEHGPCHLNPHQPMSGPAEQLSASGVDPTQHHPGDRCEFCDDVRFAADPTTCPGWVQHRTTETYRVEGWENNGWTCMSGPKDWNEAGQRMAQLKARFPEIPMRVVAETTTYTVVMTAPAQTPPTDGDQVT